MLPKAERDRNVGERGKALPLKLDGASGGGGDGRGGRKNDKGVGSNGGIDGSREEYALSGRPRSPDRKGNGKGNNGPKIDANSDVYQPDQDINRGRDGPVSKGNNNRIMHRERDGQRPKEDDAEAQQPVGTSLKRASGSTVKVSGKWVPGVEPLRSRDRDRNRDDKNQIQNKQNQRQPLHPGGGQEARKQKETAAENAAARAVEIKAREAAREAEGSAAFQKPKAPRKKAVPPKKAPMREHS